MTTNPPIPLKQSVSSAEDKSGPLYKILVVDDDLSMRALATQILSNANTEVLVADGGHSALSVLQEKPVDLILLDAQMPGLDGFETCKRIRALEACTSTPIIMTTGLNDEKSIETAFHQGADDFVVKPINWPILKQRIHKFMAQMAVNTRPAASSNQQSNGKQAHNDRELTIASLLKRDIAAQSLTLIYQPKVCSESKEIVGAEALCRWSSKELGVVSPGEFIPLAEKYDLINQLTDYVMLECMAKAKQLADLSDKPIPISFNASAKCVAQPDFVFKVSRQLKEFDLSPGLIEIEITENLMIDRASVAIRNLFQLQHIGVKIAIDDFGTGYSSISYLSQLPANVLKIDRSFVAPLGDENTAVKIVLALIQLGHNVGLQVVAEGVETSIQFKLLRDMECDVIQGYLTGKPMDFSNLAALVGMNKGASHFAGRSATS
ncbi:two-component system response regulator [Reinekea marinisedimentorum]|uniref:EAL domain-containing protein (Putative c-di-GMP-specific phosphodiesterase class I) n=1 Tax=Reinekea marinisedimentorum TaxID=230495 RepID=A0A4R3I914_9GAMM|nr:EAL domain-containing response regulator [Reinekea marinisedimentorum]TCS42368.1 EAL domain-containing protein (putative c-di-GMP-specific phosphodiesterase class I) [Reinekea marinisedimentorum]